jgi:hypothetical protein
MSGRKPIVGLASYEAYCEGMLLEAVLHLLDGNSRAWVAKRYGYSESYLTMIKRGHKRRDIRNQAIEIYDAYRREQRSTVAFDLTQVRQPATPQE